jgi:hypothetical protein
MSETSASQSKGTATNTYIRKTILSKQRYCRRQHNASKLKKQIETRHKINKSTKNMQLRFGGWVGAGKMLCLFFWMFGIVDVAFFESQLASNQRLSRRCVDNGRPVLLAGKLSVWLAASNVLLAAG